MLVVSDTSGAGRNNSVREGRDLSAAIGSKVLRERGFANSFSLSRRGVELCRMHETRQDWVHRGGWPNYVVLGSIVARFCQWSRIV